MAARKYTAFSLTIYLTIGLFGAFVLALVAYIVSVKKIDRAYGLQHQSHMLINELRQSSMDLTNMVRTYVATGKPLYLQYYRDTLALRDGHKPRTRRYQYIDGDVQPANKPISHTGTAASISLLSLMQSLDFTEKELAVLAVAKLNLDRLTEMENSAIDVLANATTDVESQRTQAMHILFDDRYNQIKDDVVELTQQFYDLMDRRTQAAIDHAEYNASLILVALIGFSLSFVLMLWYLNQALHKILGGTVNDIYTQIARIGKGDFSVPVVLEASSPNSILKWLAQTQYNLQQLNQQRLAADAGKKYSDERYIALFNNAEIGIIIFHGDANRTLIDGNKCLCNMLGYSHHELLTLKPANIVTSAEQPYIDQAMDTIAAHTSYAREWLFQRKDGSSFAADVIALALPDGTMMAMVRDISERKAVEALLHNTFKLIPTPLAIQTADGELFDCSDAFCDITGYSREQVLHRNTRDLDLWLYPEQRDEMRQLLRRDGQVDNFEFLLVSQTGEIRIMQMSVRSLGVTPEPMILSIAYDITELRQVQLALSESALHMQAILDNMHDGVITLDSQGLIESFNQAACQMFGYRLDKVLGCKVSLLIPEQHQNLHDGYLEQYFQPGHEQFLGKLREVTGQRRDGSLFPMSISITKTTYKGKTTFTGLMRDITQQRQDEEKINQLAFYDPLTNLPNRRLLFNRLQQALHSSGRTDHHGALMFLDLDHFKQLNDTLGHDVGDLLLQQVAMRLQSCVRECDSVARMGGDEFVLLLEALSTCANDAGKQAELIANKVLTALVQPYDLHGHHYLITPSIGVVVFFHQIDSIEELLKKADVAMYQAKAAGRNNVCFFDPTMQAAVAVRAALEKSMRHALVQQEFVLHYQLQVDSHGKPMGVEALVRWNHAKHGMIPPASFIPLAEETGIILPLGQWVLEAACEQLVEWAKSPETKHWTMAVNVSVSQFAQTDFVANIDQALLKTGADPHLLKLELTESMLVKDVDDVIVKMFEIKALGVTFSLDDFGTGYSSLTYLKRLPLDQLKIDQSFVRDLITDVNDAVIARTIIALGHSLSLKVIAEGVETAEQRNALAEMGCDAYQGYYFARPVEAQNLPLAISKIPL